MRAMSWKWQDQGQKVMHRLQWITLYRIQGIGYYHYPKGRTTHWQDLSHQQRSWNGTYMWWMVLSAQCKLTYISLFLSSMVHDHVVKWAMSLWVSTWLDIVISSCTTTNAILSPAFQLHWVKHCLDSTRSCWRIWMDARSKYPIPLAMLLIHHQKSTFEVKECPSHMTRHARATWLSCLTSNSLASWFFHHQNKIS